MEEETWSFKSSARSPTVVMEVDINREDWLIGDIFKPDGVMQGPVRLVLGGRFVIVNYPLGFNNSAISLLRSALEDHTAATDANANDYEWPLFFCDGDLHNRCGVIKDFSVTHDGDDVVMHDFYKCDVDPGTRITIPRRDWLAATIAFGTAVLRRLPAEKRGIKARVRPTYRRFRRLLITELERARLVGKKLGISPGIVTSPRMHWLDRALGRYPQAAPYQASLKATIAAAYKLARESGNS